MQTTVRHHLAIFLSFFAKKMFGGLENGCIFAPAFEETRGSRETRFPRGQRTVKSWDQGTACVPEPARPAGDAERVKGKQESNSYNEEFDPGSG